MQNLQRIPSSSPSPMANALRPKLDNSLTLQPCPSLPPLQTAIKPKKFPLRIHKFCKFTPHGIQMMQRVNMVCKAVNNHLSNQSDHDFRIGTAASKECPQAPSLSFSPPDRARLAPLANFCVPFCPTLGVGSLTMSQPVSRSTSLPRPCPGKKRDPGNEVVSQPIKYVFSVSAFLGPTVSGLMEKSLSFEWSTVVSLILFFTACVDYDTSDYPILLLCISYYNITVALRYCLFTEQDCGSSVTGIM